jgi:hypothetical protein
VDTDVFPQAVGAHLLHEHAGDEVPEFGWGNRSWKRCSNARSDAAESTKIDLHRRLHPSRPASAPPSKGSPRGTCLPVHLFC